MEMIYLMFYIKFVLLNYYISNIHGATKVNKPFVEVVTGSTDESDEYYVVSDNTKEEQEEYDEESVLPSKSQSHQLIPPYADVPVEYKRVCIYPNWSILRDSNMARIFPEDIDPFLCTHIHFAYANIDVRTFQLSPSQYQDFNSGDHGASLYERILRLRQINPKLKILISVGGWFAKSTPFNKILKTTTTRNTFIQNVLNFLRHWQFDGLDIQWEYPGAVEYGAAVDSKQRYTSLIKYLYKAFKDEYKTSFKRYLLSAFVPSDEEHIDAGYEVKIICKYLDYASVSTYDYTGPYDSKTGYNSPLYSRTSSQNSVNNSMHLWLDRGCPAKKLLVGIATYARAFQIVKKFNTPNLVYLGIDSEPFVSPSIYTSEEGILSYYEVCEMMTNKETRVYWDDLSEVPFAIISNANKSDTRKSDDKSSLWISYEDAKSARKKAEYVKKNSFGGVSIWSLDMDDFKGWFCNLNAFPIIESIKEEFEHKFILIDEEKNSTKGLISATTKLTQETKTTSVRHVKIKTGSTLKTQLIPSIHTTTRGLMGLDKNIIANKKNEHDKMDSKNEITSIKEITKEENVENENKNKNFSKEEPRNEPSNLDSVVRSVKKKFKAIREIKLHACLNKKLCNLGSNDSSKFYFLWQRNFLIIFSLFQLYIFLF